MAFETITHASLAQLVEAGAIESAVAVGVHGGWVVVVKYGNAERLVATQRRHPRKFRRFEGLVNYLRALNIVQFSVHSKSFDPTKPASIKAERAAERLRAVHRAAASSRAGRDGEPDDSKG